MIEKSKNLSTFAYATGNVNVFTALANNCSNLTELDLKLHDDSGIDNIDDCLSEIFKNNEKLKFIKLKNFHAITGKCFLSLAKNVVEEIELNKVRNIKQEFLIKSLPNFTKLISLQFFHVRRNALVHLAEGISLCSKLKKLTIFPKGVLEDLYLFTSSKNIESLSIGLAKDQRITERFLDYMSWNLLKLKYLDIGGDSRSSFNKKFNLNCKILKLQILTLYETLKNN